MTLTDVERERLARQGRSDLIRQSHDRAKKGRGICYEPGREWVGPDGKQWAGCLLPHKGCWHMHTECTPACGDGCAHHWEGS